MPLAEVEVRLSELLFSERTKFVVGNGAVAV